MRMKLGWLANTRPDLLYEIATLAQVTQDKFHTSKRELLKRLNRAVRYAVGHLILLVIPKLNPKTVRTVGFSDLYFASNNDLSTQLGYILFMIDANGNSALLTFKFYKLQRIAQSAMAGEVIVFADMSDNAVKISKQLSRFMNQLIALQLLTDSKSLFNVISKGSCTSKKRLVLDIAAARRQFQISDKCNIGLMRSDDNLAHGLTKSIQQAALRTCVANGRMIINPILLII